MVTLSLFKERTHMAGRGVENPLENLERVLEAADESSDLPSETNMHPDAGLWTALRLRTNFGDADTRTQEEKEADRELARKLIQGNQRIQHGGTR